MSPELDEAELERIHEDYSRDGFAILRGALSPQEIAPIQAQWRRIREPLQNRETVDGIRRDNFYIHGRLPSPVGDVYKHPKLVAVAERLIGPDLALYLNRLNVKDAVFADPIHLHQDMPYFNGSSSKINCFVALQDINLNNGAMVFVLGSQRLGAVDRSTIDISRHPELEVVVPSMRPGDLAIADIFLWHSSVPNTVGSDRVILQMIFQSAADGTYYPLSVPQPELVSGEWRTDRFEAWETITPAAEAPPADVSATILTPEPLLPRPSLQVQHHLEAVARRVLPAPVKARLKARRRARQPVAGPEQQDPAAAAPAGGRSKGTERQLPAFFTPSTGPLQVWPVPEEQVDWVIELKPTLEYLLNARKKRVLLAVRRDAPEPALRAITKVGLSVEGYLHIAEPGERPLSPAGGEPVYRPDDLPTLSGVDAVVILCTQDFALALRRCEQFVRDDILMIPGAREAIVPGPVRAASAAEWSTRSAILTYLQVSGLRGDFAEFGTFWGRSFYNSFFELHHWLEGSFYAFDSFAGLSEPEPREVAYTNGDFVKGAYGFPEASFRAIADILGLPGARIVTVPGFFDRSLSPQRASELGLKPKCLSVCRIDCDLLEPTLDVLEFVTPLLDDGALLYFDDWRLCRADPRIGERGAVLRWLADHPSLELVDFPSSHWQHQWFIFHRRGAVDPKIRQAARP